VVLKLNISDASIYSVGQMPLNFMSSVRILDGLSVINSDSNLLPLKLTLLHRILNVIEIFDSY